MRDATPPTPLPSGMAGSSAPATPAPPSPGVSPLSRCLVPLLDALGWRGDHTHLTAALPHMPEQMGLEELLNTLANLKLEGRVVRRVERHTIDSRLLPCLFLPEGGGAWVLLGFGPREDLVFDGEGGDYRQVPKGRERGEAVFFRVMDKGADSFLRQQPNWFFKVLLRFGRLFALGVVITILLSLFALVAPLFVMTVYDQALTSGAVAGLGYLAVGIGCFVAADTGFRMLRSHLFRFVSTRLGNIIGNEVLRRILYLPPLYTEAANLGAQVARIRDFETVREFFAGQAAVALFELPFLVVLVGGLMLIAPPVAWIPLVAFGLFAVLGFGVLPFVRRHNAATAQSGSDKQAFVVEMLANLRAVKYHGATHLWLERYRRLSAENTMAGYGASRLTSFINAVSYVLSMGAGLATILVGVNAVLANQMSPGALMAAMVLVWRILAPLRTGFGVLTQLGRIRRSVNQVDRLMNMRMENAQETNLSVFTGIRGRVAFSGVSIRYLPEAPPALVGVEFDLHPGEILVVMGHDGAGKSTVLKLILGLYQPQAGRVLVDHANIRQLDTVALRQAIGYAPQNDYFFYGTISQNIRLSQPEASDSQLREAARQALVLDQILAMPRGFDTRIGDHNIAQLSQSFRKRLSLTRVFLRQPRLILLDEPEQGLAEPELENLLSILAGLRGRATIVVATHSPVFKRIADQLIWLENGRMRMLKAQGGRERAFPTNQPESRGT